jgi:hypothetical protein
MMGRDFQSKFPEAYKEAIKIANNANSPIRDQDYNPFGATADDGFEDQSKDMGATSDDGYEIFTDDEGRKRITQDQYNQAKLEFLRSEGKIPEGATVNQLSLQEGGPRNTNLNIRAKEYIKNKYGTADTLSSNSKIGYEQMGGGGDFAQITSLPETSNFAQQISSKKDPTEILRTASEFATKHGKTITAASYLLDAVAPGSGKIIRTAQAVNKGYNMLTGSRDAAMDDVLTKPTGITGQVDLNETLSKGTTPEPEYDGNIGSIFFSDGGRVNFKYGSDRYGQSKKVKSAMNVDYNDPFKKLMSNDSGRFIKSTSSLTRYAKNLSKLKNSKQAKTALRKNLLVKNEKARKDALKRLSLLQKMYAGGKKSV